MKTAYLLGSIDHKAKPPRFVGTSVVSERTPTSHYYTFVIAEASGESYPEAVAKLEGYMEHPSLRWAKPREEYKP